MAQSGSLPWIILVAVICTGLAILLESAFVAPTSEALMGTDLWTTNEQTYAYEGRQMIGDFVTYLLAVIVMGIWFGVLIEARPRRGR